MSVFLFAGIPLLLLFGLPGFAAAVALQGVAAFIPRAFYLRQMFPGFDLLTHMAGVRGMLRVASRWTATIRVFADHPRARSMLYRGVFWNVWHYLLWRSALALLGPAWLRRMLVTMHLVHLRRRARAAGSGSWSVPFLIVHDAVECWAVARGAARYRTLVL
jgi:hypothetical protein